MSETEVAEGSGESEFGAFTEVIRDPNFLRVITDQVLIQNLGQSVELCALTFGAPITAVRSHDQLIDIRTTDAVNEAARLRMSWPVAVQTAMSIIAMSIEADITRSDKLIEALQAVADRKPQEDDGAAGGHQS